MRRWHRWIGLGASIFLLMVGVTGVMLQWEQFFGEEEAQKEKLRDQISAYSLDSPLTDLSSKLTRAEAAIKAKEGDAKLDKIVWQLKGDHPGFILYTDGKEKRKFTVNAGTGEIEKEEPYEDESFLLRLHTGEAFGDGGVVLGMLWGTALVVMTLTGLVIYWKMRRPGATGLKRIFWLVSISGLAATTAYAGSPFLTDDPGFAPKGWEMKFESVDEVDQGTNVLTAPVWDINYTIIEHFKLNLTLAEKTLFPRPGSSKTGLADTDFKFKWRFLDEKPDIWVLAMSMAPDVTFPTASQSQGLGDGIWRARLPFQMGKTFGKFYTYAEAGYQWAFDRQASDQVIYGCAMQYQLTDKFNIGGEINGNTPIETTANYALLANVGATYAFDDHWQLQASVGRTLRDEQRGGPKLLIQIFLQWNFW